MSGHGHQDNSVDTTAYQYWANITDGSVEIPRVKAGKYRLTVFADGVFFLPSPRSLCNSDLLGVFGDYVEDDIEIQAGQTQSVSVEWQAEGAGKELWRLGTPDVNATVPDRRKN